MIAISVTNDLYAWWAPALAFLAGLVSFASPCVFPLVPGYLAFISGGQDKDKRVGLPILLFIGGFALVFMALGAFSSVFQPVLQSEAGLRIAGVVIALFGIFMIMYALRLGWPALYAEKRPLMERVKPGPAGALPLGMAFAVGWTPCLGPVLGGILSLSALRGGSVRGAFLLLVYSAGLGVPFLLVGIGLRRLMTALSWVQRKYHWIVGVSGVVMIAIGVLMATGLWLRLLNPILQRISNFKTVL